MAAVKNIHGFTLDVKLPSRVSVSLVAGDTGNRFNIVIANGGVPMTGFTRVVAAFTRADGLVYTQDSAFADSGVTANGSVVYIDLFASSYCAGKNTCELQLYSTGTATDDTLVTTAVFSFFARAAAVNDSSIQSSAQFPALVETVYSIDNMTIDAETLADGAQATATVSEQDGVKHIHLGIPKGTPTVLVSDSVSPTSSTAGEVGQFYLNIALGHVVLYVCTSSEDSVYIWAQVYDSAASVASVNGQTGAVDLDASDVGAVPTTRTVNSKELSADIVLSAADVGAAPAMLYGDGAPAYSTAGENGQLYFNTLTGCVYVCEGGTRGVYLWSMIAAFSDSDVAVDGSVSGQRGLFEEYKVKRGVVNGNSRYTALNADDVGALPATKNGDVYELTGGLAIGGGATVNGLVQADNLTVLGASEVIGELTAESIRSQDFRCDGGLVRELGSPQSGTDAANKAYVDSSIATATTSAVAAHNLSASAHSTLFAGKAGYVDLGTDVTTDDILASNIFDTATDAATIYRGACLLNNYGNTAWVFNTPYEEDGTVLYQVMLLGGVVYSREKRGTSWEAWGDMVALRELAARKVSSITAGNSASTILYPSVKATVDYIAAAITGAIEGSY